MENAVRISNVPRSRRVAFTGYRPQKMPFGFDESDPRCVDFKKRLHDTIESLIWQGYQHFISGGAMGMDMFAAETVLELKKKYPEILLEMVSPFDAQAAKWAPEYQWRHATLFGKADIFLQELAKILNELKQKGKKVTVRAESKTILPVELRSIAIENKYFANPITLIDKRVVWFGLPHSGANFVAEGATLPTRFRPIIRFEGRHFAQALYGFLEMNKTVDQATAESAKNASGGYDTFGAYVAGEVKCPECHSPMQLKKGKTGKFFLGCTGYPKCNHTEFATEDMLISYFYFKNPNGKRCPRDNTSLDPYLGKYGMYIRCNGIERHTFRLDEV